MDYQPEVIAEVAYCRLCNYTYDDIVAEVNEVHNAGLTKSDVSTIVNTIEAEAKAAGSAKAVAQDYLGAGLMMETYEEAKTWNLSLGSNTDSGSSSG